jgi:hypothetical protein
MDFYEQSSNATQLSSFNYDENHSIYFCIFSPSFLNIITIELINYIISDFKIKGFQLINKKIDI